MLLSVIGLVVVLPTAVVLMGYRNERRHRRLRLEAIRKRLQEIEQRHR